jgi:hypothetical protein
LSGALITVFHAFTHHFMAGFTAASTSQDNPTTQATGKFNSF